MAPPTVQEIQQQINLALSQREDNFALATTLSDAAKNMTLADLPQLKTAYDRLPEIEQEFKKFNFTIKKCNVHLPVDNQIETSKPYVAFVQLIDSIRAKYFQLKKTEPAVADVVPSGNVPSVANPHLPKIHIPKFNGKLSEWPNFFALFDSMVHKNQQLSVIAKLQYLKTSVVDEAASVIASFHLTEANYELALDALTSRYNNPRQIGHMYLKNIIDFPTARSNSLSDLKSFLTTHENSASALKALAFGDLSDFLLVSLALKNLDSKSRHDFELKHDSTTVPTFQSLLDFVDQRIKTIETAQLIGESSVKSRPAVKSLSYIAQDSSASSKPSSTRSHSASCFCCSQKHHISQCHQFQQLPISARYDVLKKHQRCFNCLGGHLLSKCPSTSSCRKCHSPRHNTLLHPDPQIATPPAAATHLSTITESNGNPTAAAVVLSCSAAQSTLSERTYSLLGTFRAFIIDCTGSMYPIRGVVDPGSQLSFLSKRVVQNLRLPTSPTRMSVSGIGSSDTLTTGSVNIQLASRLNNKRLSLCVAVINTIAHQLPSMEIPKEKLKRFFRLRLADPHFHRPDRIDILLGADVFPRLITQVGIQPSQQGPISIGTIFGHIIVGPIPIMNPTPPIVSLLSTTEVDKQLTAFWDVESINQGSISNPLDDIAEQHFISTFRRNAEGRYSVALPFHPSATPLGYNSPQARVSMSRLEHRLAKHGSLVSEYQTFMSEYMSLGHMEPASTPASYIIPHHIVTKETNQGVKIRVVFNASVPDSTGISLNQRLLKGPKLQQDLSHVILSFRLNTIALCCDIKQMYRQVLVHPEHRQYQHILWRPSEHADIQEMQLNTVTYGMAPSAFLAVRVLHQLVHDEGHRFPMAAHALMHNSYVDDIICGAPSLSDAAALQSQLTELLALGGFQLRKWSSSHPELLTTLPHDHLECPLLFSDPDRTLKILGLNWEPSSDSFLFRVTPFDGTCTKRSLLSYIARIFDPNGFVAPVTFALKAMLQQLWLSGITWDEPITQQLQQSWSRLVHNMDALACIRIPRHIIQPDGASFSLIGFADASQLGYAAVAYLCVETPHLRTSTLWKAKTRVAPLKTLSIPRLELCAALLLSELICSLLNFSYPSSLHTVRLFSDSQVVLSWIHTPPHLLKTFVAHRISRIREIPFTNHTWSHVSSDQNPADMASRGLTSEQFLAPNYQQLWFCGPPFANQSQFPWPDIFVSSAALTDQLPELRNSIPVSLVATSSSNFLHDLLNRFSSLNRARRILGWILRFTNNARISTSSLRTRGDLQVSEIQSAMQHYVLAIQHMHFSAEIDLIKAQRNTKSLQSLTPFIDEAGVLRVGGRLSRSQLQYPAQHPILLPKRAHLSSLIAHHAHLSCLHAGPSACMAQIRCEYWILSLRSLIRSVILSCRTCKRFRARSLQPLMSDLPSVRLTPGRPFITSGVDYAGPFNVKSSRLRKAPNTKGYLCLFVCLTTKALHLEFASELSTPAFLSALDRFIARRGLPHSIWSDRGTNFVGANRVLKEASQFLSDHSSDITSHLSSRGIQWHFNPPSAPNFGGIWEAGVKSVKTILSRITADLCFTSEEYFTLFARIEAILNSRPLCPLSSDPLEASDYLSPGHFLIGAPMLARPEVPSSQSFSPVNRWKAITQITRQFWDRWSREFINTLMQRNKWNCPSKEISVGDVVLIKGVATHPLHWPMARVESLHPGADGVTRVVTIRNASGSFVRPVNRLVPLDDQA